MFSKTAPLKNVDSEIWNQIVNETIRQEEHIELIASENYTSPAVMEAQGSQLLINMLKDILVKDSMGAASMWMLSRGFVLID